MASQKSFNVVLPQAPGYNAGMAVVDLGLISASERLGFNVIPWRLGVLADRALATAPDLDRQMDMGLPAAGLVSGGWPADLEDPVLYWGDFHHMATYVDDVGKFLGRPLGGHRAARRHLLLEGASTDALERAGSFGTTLIFNSNEDLRSGPYADALRTFVASNTITAFRDPISTSLVRKWASRDNVMTGADPALMIQPSQIPDFPGSDRPVGVFLGRSSSTHSSLWMVARVLAEEFDVGAEWIDWGDSRGFPAMSLPADITVPEPFEGDGTNGEPSRAMSALSHLASCSAVVTDSYHAALIAWRLGIAAVTVSSGPSRSRSSVNGGVRWSWRDKRELAASQYGALELVIRSEELADDDALAERISELKDLMTSGEAIRSIQNRIEEEAAASLGMLSRAFRFVATSEPGPAHIGNDSIS